MNRLEQIKFLNARLLDEMPDYKPRAARFGEDPDAQRRLLRSLMNLRRPGPLSRAFLEVQDALLSAEREEKGIVELAQLPVTKDPRLYLWKGDITRLKVDAIVNAANAAMLGCFVPCHSCIDNVIHSAAGLQLREECHEIMARARQPHEAPTGSAIITGAYNLPARHVIHTVGPIIQREVSPRDKELLAACYRSCLSLAEDNGLNSIAFCCVSTGVYRFPKALAAEIAVSTVKAVLDSGEKRMKVIFNVFTEEDDRLYRNLLCAD